MIKPTEHYDGLREALNVYHLDANYSTVEECVAHVLFDVRVWARSCGIDRNFPDALRLCIDMEIEQHKQAIREMEELEAA